MGVFTRDDRALEWRGGHETGRVAPWGPDSLRARGTVWEKGRDDLPHALNDPAPHGAVPGIGIGNATATVANAGLTAENSPAGELGFLDGAGTELLAEPTPHVTGPPTRRYRSASGGMHRFEVQFAARD